MSETGYGLMKLGISSQDLQDFLFHQDSIWRRIGAQHWRQIQMGYGETQTRDQLRWENQFGPLFFSHVLFISPTFDFVPNSGKTGAQYLQLEVLHTDNAANISKSGTCRF
jgi:hypothetical protein